MTWHLPSFILTSLFCFIGLPARAQTTGPAAPVQPYKTLTGTERWHLYWDETLLSPGLYFASLGAATGSQLANDPPEWHQGAEGYFRRSASLLGLFTIQETVHQAGAAALRYDPRYLPCGCKGAMRRIGHAIKWSVFTKNAAGQTRLDVPTLAGAYGSGMLSTYWYPARYRPLSDGVRIGNQQAGFVFGVNLVKEFGPEIKRLIPHF